jgi:hypothetical protein
MRHFWSFCKHLMSTDSVPGPVLGREDKRNKRQPESTELAA